MGFPGSSQWWGKKKKKKTSRRCKSGDATLLVLTPLFLSCTYTLLNIFIYLLLAVLGLCCCTGFALVVASRGHSPVAKLGLLVVEASLVAKYGFQQLSLPGCRTQAQ